MDRSDFLYKEFSRRFAYEPTPCQDALMHKIASFLTGDDGDILVVNGYAGTGKTTAISVVIDALEELKLHTVLLAPTGRAAKVLSGMARRPAYTIHKHIYRQKSVGADGFGQFSLSPNKARNTLFVVDEVSLIGIEESAHQGTTAFGTGNLLEDLIAFVRAGSDCRLILIGDAAQLPPVGLDASPALSPDYMDGFGGVDYAELTSVVRQASESGILRNATRIREMIRLAEAGEEPGTIKLNVQGCSDIVRIGGGELIDTLTSAYGDYGEDGTIILCRSNKRAIRYNLGVRAQVQYNAWCAATGL